MAKAEPQPVARLWLKGEAMAQGQGYTVKSNAPVALGSDVQARLFTLASGETIPWHFHRRTADELAGEYKVGHLCVYINADRSG